MNDKVKQFDSISGKYSSFVDGDPVRNFLHYPAVVSGLGNIKEKNILDIGCGDGLFDRKLAKEYGVKVVGYDKGSDLIAVAKKHEESESLGIIYSIDDPITFTSNISFDAAVSIMVLPYSPDKEYLNCFFKSAYNHLKDGAVFVSVVINPNFNYFDKLVANRIFKKLHDGEVEVNFLNPETKEVKFTAKLKQFSKEDYEDSALKSGFKKISWKSLIPIQQGIEILGSEFWKSCQEEQPYALCIVEK